MVHTFCYCTQKRGIAYKAKSWQRKRKRNLQKKGKEMERKRERNGEKNEGKRKNNLFPCSKEEIKSRAEPFFIRTRRQKGRENSCFQSRERDKILFQSQHFFFLFLSFRFLSFSLTFQFLSFFLPSLTHFSIWYNSLIQQEENQITNFFPSSQSFFLSLSLAFSRFLSLSISFFLFLHLSLFHFFADVE